MLLIAENINVMSKTIGPALKERNAKAIQDLAKAEAKSGVDYLDLNIGPARKDGDQLMDWVVKTVQEVVDKPMSLDTTNTLAIEAGLKAHKGKAIINSISLDRMDVELPFAKKYNAYMIGLLWGREGLPRDAAERGVIAVELVYAANNTGIANEEIFIDPIVTPVTNIESNHVKPCLEFMSMVNDIAPGCKSIVGISNVSNGAPTNLRPYLNRTYLMMLMKYGLSAAIVDAFDPEIIDIGRSRKPELVKLVHRIMGGEKPDPSSLNEEELKYVKTVRVLNGDTLYTDSWLEL